MLLKQILKAKGILPKKQIKINDITRVFYMTTPLFFDIYILALQLLIKTQSLNGLCCSGFGFYFLHLQEALQHNLEIVVFECGTLENVQFGGKKLQYHDELEQKRVGWKTL